VGQQAPVRARDVVHFIETYCRIPDGERIGEPIRLADFQTRFIAEVYDNPAGPTRRAILSIARKNLKTTLAACLTLNHLVGPSAQVRPNSELFSTAQSRDQAALIFSIASKMVRLDPSLRGLDQSAELPRTRNEIPGAIGRSELGARAQSGLRGSR